MVKTITPATIFEQTGWKGMLPVSICQDIEILQGVTEYDYDLHDPEFEKYCVARLGHARAEYKPAFEHICDYGMKKEVWFDQYRTNRIGTVFSDDDLEVLWESRRIHMGKYQDCWEIFTGRRGQAKVAVSYLPGMEPQ